MRIAAIDIGSNSVHMVLVEASGDGVITTIDRAKDMIKLGADVFKTQELGKDALERAHRVLKRYVDLADQLRADEILAVATSAVREAKNAGDLLDPFRESTGVTAQLISGEEEARLIQLAVRRAIELRRERGLVIDIGGGSTELAVGTADRYTLGASLKLGVQRLKATFGDGELSKKQVKAVRGQVRERAQAAIAQVRDLKPSIVIGTSGTIRTLAEAILIEQRGKRLQHINAEKVSQNDLRALVEKLSTMSMKQRLSIEPIEEKRADAIHLGGWILVELLHALEQDELTVSDASLRDGVVLDFLSRSDAAVRQSSLSVRERAVRHLALQYDRGGPQDALIERHARELFAMTARDHLLPVGDCELLAFAAQLHAIGRYVDFKRNHKHGYYLIRHARLRGFTDDDATIVGQLVRYHRKSRPAKRHKRYRRLPKAMRRRVRILSALLRIAIALDRGATQVVQRITAKRDGKTLIVTAHCQQPPANELWAAARRAPFLKDELGVDMKFEAEVETTAADD